MNNRAIRERQRSREEREREKEGQKTIFLILNDLSGEQQQQRRRRRDKKSIFHGRKNCIFGEKFSHFLMCPDLGIIRGNFRTEKLLSSETLKT